MLHREGGSSLRPDELAISDLDVEFEDLLVFAKLFKRPWSYLLVDEAEQFSDAGDDNRPFDNQKAALERPSKRPHRLHREPP